MASLPPVTVTGSVWSTFGSTLALLRPQPRPRPRVVLRPKPKQPVRQNPAHKVDAKGKYRRETKAERDARLAAMDLLQYKPNFDIQSNFQVPIPEALHYGSLAPQTVARSAPTSNAIAQLQSLSLPSSYAPTVKRPAVGKVRVPKPKTAKRGTLTGDRIEQLKSATKPKIKTALDLSRDPFLGQPQPQPKRTKSKEDECREVRKKKRRECPLRGYRLQATSWRKVPCR